MSSWSLDLMSLCWYSRTRGTCSVQMWIKLNFELQCPLFKLELKSLVSTNKHHFPTKSVMQSKPTSIGNCSCLSHFNYQTMSSQIMMRVFCNEDKCQHLILWQEEFHRGSKCGSMWFSPSNFKHKHAVFLRWLVKPRRKPSYAQAIWLRIQEIDHA